MYIAELCNNNLANEENTDEVNEEYWSQSCQTFFEEEIRNMTNWLSDVKKNEKSENQLHPNNDIKLFNSSQRRAYNIVDSHFRNPQNQLLMIITGLSGNGKSFAIDALRALLKKKLYCDTVFEYFHI